LARTARWLQTLDRTELATLAGVVAVAVVVRVLFLFEPTRYDEAYTFDSYAIHSVRFIATTYDAPNNQIFSTLLTHFAWRLFGNHLWTVRFTAFTAGVAIVPAVYLVGQELYDRATGLWAAGLAATFAPLVDYSVDGRGYSLGTLLILAQLWLGSRLLADSRRLEWIAFALCAALAVYTVSTMAFGVVTVGVWMFGVMALRRNSRDGPRLAHLMTASAGAGLLTLILFAPVLGQPGWAYVQPLPAQLGAIRGLVANVWLSWNRAAPEPLPWLLTAAFVLGVLLQWRIARHRFPLVLAAALVLAAVTVIDVIPPFERSWLYLAPLYLVTAAAGLAWICRQIARRVGHGRIINAVGVAAVMAALSASVVNNGQHGSEQDPSADNHIVSFLKRHVGPGEVVALDTFMQVPAIYYLDRYSYSPPEFTAASQRAGKTHVLVLMIGNPGPNAVLALLRKTGAVTGPHTRTRLITRLPYITAYDVELRRS
jgi:4-amino-4-deoxy-L-arabinose transferase-like glycosyltransferase